MHNMNMRNRVDSKQKPARKRCNADAKKIKGMLDGPRPDDRKSLQSPRSDMQEM